MGAEFTVYQDERHLLLGPIVGVLVVYSIRPFETIMRIPQGCHDFTLEHPGIAIQTKAGRDQELRLHVPLQKNYLSVFQAFLLCMKRVIPNPCKIALVENRSAASLEAIRRGDKISFNILDTRIAVHRELIISHTVDANVTSISPVLEAAAHYFYHLNRTCMNPLIYKHVIVEMFKLVMSGTFDEDTGLPIYVTSGANLILLDKILRHACDHITPSYGFSIKNNSGRNLFINCFYFDNGDLSISRHW